MPSLKLCCLFLYYWLYIFSEFFLSWVNYNVLFFNAVIDSNWSPIKYLIITYIGHLPYQTLVKCFFYTLSHRQFTISLWDGSCFPLHGANSCLLWKKRNMQSHKDKISFNSVSDTRFWGPKYSLNARYHAQYSIPNNLTMEVLYLSSHFTHKEIEVLRV